MFFLVYLAGVPVPVDLAQHLARHVEDDLGAKLLDAVTHHTDVVDLEPEEREQLLAALADADEAPLAELRDVLAAEHSLAIA
jgi:hypothetical protein